MKRTAREILLDAAAWVQRHKDHSRPRRAEEPQAGELEESTVGVTGGNANVKTVHKNLQCTPDLVLHLVDENLIDKDGNLAEGEEVVLENTNLLCDERAERRRAEKQGVDHHQAFSLSSDPVLSKYDSWIDELNKTTPSYPVKESTVQSDAQNSLDVETVETLGGAFGSSHALGSSSLREKRQRNLFDVSSVTSKPPAVKTVESPAELSRNEDDLYARLVHRSRTAEKVKLDRSANFSLNFNEQLKVKSGNSDSPAKQDGSSSAANVKLYSSATRFCDSLNPKLEMAPADREVRVKAESSEKSSKKRNTKSSLFGSDDPHSLANALSDLKRQRALDEDVMRLGRKAHKTKLLYTDINDVHLDYKDEYGRDMTPQEAFRRMSWVFHGMKPGRRKTEKRLIKREAEMRTLKRTADSNSTFMALSKVQNTNKVSHMKLD